MDRKLLKIQSTISRYSSEFKSSKVLAVSEDKDSIPFLYFISEGTKVLVSIAVDYPQSFNVAEIVLKASEVAKLTLAEPYFLSESTGRTSFGSEAYQAWDLDSINLEEVLPLTNSRH